MVRPLIAGNWKMNGSRAFAEELVTGLVKHSASIAQADVVICPPSIYLQQVQQLLSGSNDGSIRIGAQNVGTKDEGAFTGELSTRMLAEFHCSYVIVGHSERRALFLESNEEVAEKFQAAQRGGLIPILCIGESLEQREANDTFSVLEAQLEPLLRLPINVWEKAVIAYEPVWAIGTGKTASSAMAQETHQFIRQFLAQQNEQV
ncbi:MAG: triose-phosphate isomerase, partial [Pseudomonadales bacterium]|nr:triose-phosphate isomerase [Pseudomonadales bacterium]